MVETKQETGLGKAPRQTRTYSLPLCSFCFLQVELEPTVPHMLDTGSQLGHTYTHPKATSMQYTHAPRITRSSLHQLSLLGRASQQAEPTPTCRTC